MSETEDCRIWLIDLAPGERLGFHTHVLNYFWVATTAGRARSHFGDGRVVERDYAVGDVQHMRFGPGESMTHDLANIGTTRLAFTTVEDKRGANPPPAPVRSDGGEGETASRKDEGNAFRPRCNPATSPTMIS